MNREALNEWVIEKLNTHNMSMRELGRRTDMQHGNISKVLSGKQNAALDFYVKIAQAFDAIPEMMQEAGIISGGETDEVSLLELFRIIKGLSPEERREVEDFVDYLTHRASRQKTNLATGDA